MQRPPTLAKAKQEWEQYLSPKEPHEGSNMSKLDHNGNHWSTFDELNRLRVYAEVNPKHLLAAYNATRMRSNWGNLDGAAIQAEASKLAKAALIRLGSDLALQIKDDWFHALRLAKGVADGK